MVSSNTLTEHYRPGASGLEMVDYATLSEVKNVKSLSFARQLRDYEEFAAQTGRRFDLYVRSSTRLSGPLRAARDAGLINIVPF